jgi:type IV secretion system protein VirB10
VSELPDPRWLITQGRLLPCTQQTAFDSSLPGPVTAIIPEDVRGETGDVVLIPKGARVFGTIQHALTNGLDRLAVLWQTISWMLYDNHDLPHLYRIDANSSASSELGEAGLDGDVNHHYLKKIGGILGLSLIQGGIEYGVARAQSNGHGNTSINLDSFQSGGNQAANTLLQSWIAIPDVMHRNQGLACGIFIVRDLDIRGAYELRTRR